MAATGSDVKPVFSKVLPVNNSYFFTISDISDLMENMQSSDDNNDDVCTCECNGRTLVTLDSDYKDVEEDFVFTYVDEEEKSSIALQNGYIQKLLQHAKLEMLQKYKVKFAYSSRKKIDLLHLFLTKGFFESLLMWTNTCIEEKGKKKMSASKFLACIGLELAMSIIQLNNISDWSSKNV